MPEKNEKICGSILHEKIEDLESQMERGGIFTHSALSQNAERLNQAEFLLCGLVNVLVKKGIIEEEEIFSASEKVSREMMIEGEHFSPGVMMRFDRKESHQKGNIPVNCKERFPICKAVCCRLGFALSSEEIEDGKVKWDLGRPYFIRQSRTGCCCHLDEKTGMCRIYEHRPLVCRVYSCANDSRIWKDFHNKELNEEWINEHLNPSRPRLAAALMHKADEMGSPEAEEESVQMPDIC